HKIEQQNRYDIRKGGIVDHEFFFLLDQTRYARNSDRTRHDRQRRGVEKRNVKGYIQLHLEHPGYRKRGRKQTERGNQNRIANQIVFFLLYAQIQRRLQNDHNQTHDAQNLQVGHKIGHGKTGLFDTKPDQDPQNNQQDNRRHIGPFSQPVEKIAENQYDTRCTQQYVRIRKIYSTSQDK